jgi:glyoxylase I family protein
MFGKIHHIAIICSNYEASKDFYINKLGFEVVKETYREERQSYKLDLTQGDIQIELFTFPNSPTRPSYPEALGLRHLAFSVSDMEKAKQELESKGIILEDIRIDELTGKKYTFFSDPDGLPLEIYQS